MTATLIAPALALVITVALVVMLRPLAWRIGLTDKPAQRKQHSGEVPLIGGIAVYSGMCAAMIALALLPEGLRLSQPVLAWLGAGALLVVVGAYDDLRELSPGVRFAAQIAAVLIMVFWGGVVLQDLGRLTPDGSMLRLGIYAVPFTVFAGVGVINAFNMCDGLDGLSGNLALVTLLAFGLADGLWGGSVNLPLINILSAAIIGFLIFNQRMHWRSKAAVFLGDAGSLMLGFYLVWCAIDLSQHSDRSLSPAAALWFLMIPIFDTVRVMLRRLLQGRSPFRADATHLHHLLVRCGWGVSEAIVIICIAAAGGASVGLIANGMGASEFWLAMLFSAAGIGYFVVIEYAWKSGRFMGRTIQPLAVKK